MGVKGAFAFIEKKVKIQEGELLEDFGKKYQHFFYDLFGCHWFSIQKAFKNGQDPFGKVVELVQGYFAGVPKDKVTIVLDGNPTEQKQATYSQRIGARPKSATKKELFKLKQLTNSKYLISFEEKKQLVKVSSEAGFKVHLALGEADLYIANLKNSVCVSSDSDYLFHKTVNVLGRYRVENKVAKVYTFEKVKLLEKLKISAPKWVVLGIVSGNDYCCNIKGVAITNAFEKLQFSKKTDVMDILLEFCNLLKTPASQFDHAVSVFEYQKETLIEKEYEVVNLKMSELSQRWMTLKGDYDKQISNYQTTIVVEDTSDGIFARSHGVKASEPFNHFMALDALPAKGKRTTKGNTVSSQKGKEPLTRNLGYSLKARLKVLEEVEEAENNQLLADDDANEPAVTSPTPTKKDPYKLLLKKHPLRTLTGLSLKGHSSEVFHNNCFLSLPTLTLSDTSCQEKVKSGIR